MSTRSLMIDDASINANFDDFANLDGPDGPTDRQTDGQTPAYWDAMDASKNGKTKNMSL